MLYSLTVVALIVVAVLLFAVKIVPPGVEVPVERLGRFVRMTGPGVHLVVPFVDRFRTPVSTREETLRTPERPFATRARPEIWVRSDDIRREAERLLADACRPWGLAISRLEVDGWRR